MRACFIEKSMVLNQLSSINCHANQLPPTSSCCCCCWPILGPMLAHLHPMLCPLPLCWAPLGPMLGHLGPMLGHLGAMLTPLGPILGASVGSSWGTFCAICVDAGPSPKKISDYAHPRGARFRHHACKAHSFCISPLSKFGLFHAHKTL